MGGEINLICSNCHYTIYALTQGIGMLYYPENMFEGINDGVPLIFHLLENEPAIQKQYHELRLKGAVPLDTYGHQIYICKNCNSLYSKFYFCLKTSESYDKSKYYEPEYYCNHCNQSLVLANVENGKIYYMNSYKNKYKVKFKKSEIECKWSCPRCGNHDLTYEWGMDWD